MYHRAMKVLHTAIMAVLTLILVIGCNGSPIDVDGNDGTEDPGNGAADTNLSIVQKDIETISPYAYGSIDVRSSALASGSGRTAKAALNPDETILSYIGPGEVGFQPLVFQNSSGSKFIFRNVTVSEIGGDYYLCYMQELQKVSKEPRVIYEEVETVDEEGNTIYVYEPREIEVEVTRGYGENEAIIDTASGNVYLTIDPEGYDGIFVEYQDSFQDYRIETPNALFLSGYVYGSGGNDRNMFMIRKDAIDAGTLFPMLNTSVLDLRSPMAASDDLAVFMAKEKGTDKSYVLIRKTHSYADPVRLEFTPYEIQYEASDGSMQTVVLDVNDFYDSIVLDRDIIHVVRTVDDDLYILNYSVSDDEIVQEGYQKFEGLIDNEWVGSPELFDKWYDGDDVDAYFIMQGTGKAMLIKISFRGSDTEVIVLEAGNEEVADTTFSAVGDRIYWMRGGAYSSDAAICYADFSARAVTAVPLQGKSAASSKVNPSEDGTVIFWQNMGGSVGVFSMNVNDPVPMPELLMRNEVDVEQIINIDSL